ncbi:4460_t:CDS:2, partial [Diversispora eburnea]
MAFDFDHNVAIKHNGQRVLLLLDNCGSHKIEGLNLLHVDIHFLPPNTTSRIQPMDSVIIMSFKRHYRNYHIQWIFIQDLKMDILQAIRFVILSWNEITIETIRSFHLPNEINVEEFLSMPVENIIYEVLEVY